MAFEDKSITEPVGKVITSPHSTNQFSNETHMFRRIWRHHTAQTSYPMRLICLHKGKHNTQPLRMEHMLRGLRADAWPKSMGAGANGNTQMAGEYSRYVRSYNIVWQ